MPTIENSKRKAIVQTVDERGEVTGQQDIELEVPYDIVHRQFSEYLLAAAFWWSSKAGAKPLQWDTTYVTSYDEARFATGELLFMVKEGATDWFDFVMRRGDRTYWIISNPDTGMVDAEIILS